MTYAERRLVSPSIPCKITSQLHGLVTGARENQECLRVSNTLKVS